MKIKTKNPKYKIRLTRCWLVELVDNEERVEEAYVHGRYEELDSYCFGTKEQAIAEGERLLYIKESEEENACL